MINHFTTVSDILFKSLRVSKQVWSDMRLRAKIKRLEPYVDLLHLVLALPRRVEIRVASVNDVHGECYEGGRQIILDGKLRFDVLLKTLCHEMTHAQQFQTGRLKFKNGYDIWEGKKWTECMSTARTPHGVYRSAPWEVEAYAAEKTLYKTVSKMIHSEK
jgi:hypothetical protein